MLKVESKRYPIESSSRKNAPKNAGFLYSASRSQSNYGAVEKTRTSIPRGATTSRWREFIKINSTFDFSGNFCQRETAAYKSAVESNLTITMIHERNLNGHRN